MTLRVRLLLAFAALALLPTAALTVFTLDRLNRSIALWSTPGVSQTLDSALEVSRTAVTRMEATVRTQAMDWAAALPAARLDADRRDAVRAGMRAAGLDYVQIYRRAGGSWSRIDEVLPEAVLSADSPDFAAEIDSALALGRLLRTRPGALAAAAGVGDRAIVAGMRVPPDFHERLQSVTTGVALYHRLGVVRDVSLTWTLALVAGLVLTLAALALVAATVLARAMTRPLRRLEEAVERVAGGDLETRVVPEGAPELRTLGHRFNAMTERLSAARVALAAAEREAAWREVARRLAHEFKNILTPLSLSLHRLRRRADHVADAERAAVAESLAALEDGVADLTRLAEQFSLYARLPEPRHEALDLAELARAAVRLHEPGGLTVTLDAPAAVPVTGDRLLLSRAIHNLVLNACEASAAGGAVEVRVAADGDVAVLEVLDRGSGLPPGDAERLFAPYVTTRARGSGLGLTLVREIAGQHRGRVEIAARPGGGAAARLTLPRRQDAAT